MSNNNTDKRNGNYKDNGSNSNLLSISNLSKNFEPQKGSRLKVLENVSLDLRIGEVTALVGPSGCGKTTLLNIIAGLIAPDRGQIKQEKDLNLAYIFQETRLLPWRTVESNISFVQENYLPDNEAAEIRERLLHFSGLYDMKESYPAQLSGGMKQRLEVIRALSIRPDLLLMDEPFKSLDISLKYQLQDILLEEFSKEKFSILLITHDPEDAVLLADRILILSNKPSRVYKEFAINIAREKRNLKDEDIYTTLQDILKIIS
ncbi:MAG: ABC transporter ATP-binding protein [Halanaerobiales bacterium]